MTREELRAFRKSKAMNQAELAAALNVSRKTVVNWETGTYAVPRSIMDMLAAAGLNGTVETKATTKAELQRQKEERELIAFWRSSYRGCRAFQHNHTLAMAVYKQQGHVVPPAVYAALVADFPDILSDPDGYHPMNKDAARVAVGLPPTDDKTNFPDET